MYYDKPPVDELMHIGVARRSGRYPWGSGEDPHQHGSGDFASRVEELRKSKLEFTDADGVHWTGDNAIAKSMGMSTTEFRRQYSESKNERRRLNVETAKSLLERTNNISEVGRQMGVSESTVRSWLNENSEARMNTAMKTAEFLKKQVEEKGFIDVGKGVEKELNISRTKLDEALTILQNEGYMEYGRSVSQINNPGKQTTLKVLCPPGTEHSDIYKKPIQSINDYISTDGGDTFKKGFVYPESLNSKRLEIKYAEDGGDLRDGLVELRRGVPDLDLGNSNYAQVRILVDNERYIKGMAVYADDLPDGVDVRFHTNKSKEVPKMEVLKKIKDDPANPFGALIKEHGGQYFYTDKDGKEKLGLINKRSEEGDWEDWADKLPSQFLSKQNLSLIKKQLKMSEDEKVSEFKEIMALDNPTVKKKLLQEFSDECDASAVHLKAASLPRQKYKVLIPFTDIKDDEVYAPTYEDGEKIALIRYPHGGIFEIPILTVNNKIPSAKKTLGNAIDAIGINKKVADQLSGADFDGDTVTTIPTSGNGKNTKIKISNRPPLQELEGFDPKVEYGGKKEGTFKQMKNTQMEMGKISNLITDMTLKGATYPELAKAVKHSMVVIDAEKHKLDYKQSEKDNDIAALRKKYQQGGASTLISQAKSPVEVLKRKGSPKPDPVTGKKVYKEVEEYYTDKNGNLKVRTQKSTKMYETDDARTLSSGTVKEELYADYANKLKALGNEARKEMLTAGKISYSKEANLKYQNEAKSLKAKLDISQMNAPKERKAQILANEAVRIRREAYKNTDMSDYEIKKELKKVGQQELTRYRNLLGAKRILVDIDEKEWEAIQAGAISESRLKQILDNCDMDSVRKLATPRTSNTVSDYKISRIKSMNNSGYTIAEIAKALGVSTSEVSKNIK